MNGTLCVVDVESGGFLRDHPTIQIAAIAVDDIWREIDSVEVKLHFDPANCDPDALAMNSYDPDVWEREAVTAAAALAQLQDFFTRHRTWELISEKGHPYRIARIAGHNVSFDMPRLKALWGGSRTPFLPRYAHDTMQLAFWAFANSHQHRRPQNYKLETLCGFFGIDTAGAHDALTDVRITAQLARELLALA